MERFGIFRQMPVRAALALLVGLLAALALPAWREWPSFVGPGLVVFSAFAAAVLFFSWRTYRRRQEFTGAVYLELNKLRRLYHLSRNLADGSSRFRPWFTDLHGNLHMYLAAFEGSGMDEYRLNNAGFRRLSYNAYDVPELSTDRERLLYAEILRTVGTIAEARQRIKDSLAAGMNRSDWSWIGLLAAAASLTAAGMIGDFGGHLSESIVRMAVGLALAAIVCSLDYIRHLDAMKGEKADLTARYVRNIGKLNYERRES